MKKSHRDISIFTKALPFVLLVGGIIGVLCAGILTYDKIELLQHPGSATSCDLNPIIACGPVINKPQAAAFGFPNPFLGLVGFAVVATIGAAMLAGAAFRRWFWLGLQVGVTFGILFVTWLQYESIYHIGALCPFCMITWAVMIPMFWYTTLYNLHEGHIQTPARLKSTVAFAQRHHGDILVIWFLVLTGLILHRFWFYWQTLI